jgi:hypothetical protein
MNKSMLIRTQKIAEKWTDTLYDQPMLGGRCIYFAIVARDLLGADIIAGSAQWQFRDDDGVASTHFAYMFNQELQPRDQQFKIAESRLPEMHVWNLLDDKFLDLSTKYLPEQLRLGLGRDWDQQYAIPPIYFGNARTEDNKIIYIPNKQATELANKFINEMLVGGT